MSESLNQTQDRLADEILAGSAPEADEQQGQVVMVETRRSYPGTLPSDKALDPNSESYGPDKWARAHEKRRLRAYLKGHQYFAHGRVPALPFGFRPKIWAVIPQEQ